MDDMDNEAIVHRKWMEVFCGEPIKLKLLTVNQFTDFEFDIENAKWEIEYKDFSILKPVRVCVGKGGELCIPADEVKKIWETALGYQGNHGTVQLIEIHVTFDKVYADGSREPCEQTQQISVHNITREHYIETFGTKW